MPLLEHVLRASVDKTRPELVDEDGRHAAVAIVVRFAPHAEILIIRRAENPADRWSGQLAFPGGRHDAGDGSLLDTARRETREEVGIDLLESEYAGCIEVLKPPAASGAEGLTISPFVFVLSRGERRLALDASEVADAMWVPVEPMWRGETSTIHHFKYRGREHELPAFDVGGRHLWGLTYRMLTTFFDVIRAGGTHSSPTR